MKTIGLVIEEKTKLTEKVPENQTEDKPKKPNKKQPKSKKPPKENEPPEINAEELPSETTEEADTPNEEKESENGAD